MPKYTVLAEGWLTNARGHGAHYVPAKEGEEPLTIELSEREAQYLIASGQIGEMPAEKPADEVEVPEGVVPGGPNAPGEGAAERGAGVAGAEITPVEPAAPVTGADGSDAGRTASRRQR